MGRKMRGTLRDSILRRDQWSCQYPGCTLKIGAFNPLSVHHIDHDNTNDNPDNLTTLCMRHNQHIEATYVRGLRRQRKILDAMKYYKTRQLQLGI